MRARLGPGRFVLASARGLCVCVCSALGTPWGDSRRSRGLAATRPWLVHRGARTRIGNEHADSLLTYPQAHNLSAKARDSSTPRCRCCAPHTATTPHTLWCSVLSDLRSTRSRSSIATSLNAPYGAPYFLTHSRYIRGIQMLSCLNTPYGAPCFLTRKDHQLISRAPARS